jgi:hypothetical protein
VLGEKLWSRLTPPRPAGRPVRGHPPRYETDAAVCNFFEGAKLERKLCARSGLHLKKITCWARQLFPKAVLDAFEARILTRFRSALVCALRVSALKVSGRVFDESR